MGAATSQISYTASKGGVLAMSRELGVQFAREGIRVNALCPGPVNTPLLQELFAKDPERAARRLVHVPMGRFAEPEEIASAVAFLASDDASFITAADVPGRRRHPGRVRHADLGAPLAGRVEAAPALLALGVELGELVGELVVARDPGGVGLEGPGRCEARGCVHEAPSTERQAGEDGRMPRRLACIGSGTCSIVRFITSA